MSLMESFNNEKAWKGQGIREGEDIERATFGIPEIASKDRKKDYMPFTEAVNFVKEHQPSLLKRTPIAKQLRQLVAGKAYDTTQPVKFFTAVGTPLDIYHGVDAFIEQGNIMVTIDVSAREKEVYKADVLLNCSLDRDGKLVVAETEMQNVASKIADVLNSRLHRAA